MKLVFRLLSSLFIWVLSAMLMFLIVLLPRNTDSTFLLNKDIMFYHFTWKAYGQNIIHFIRDFPHGMGMTNLHVPVIHEIAIFGGKSLAILIPALFFSFIIGIYKGVFDFKRKGSVGKVIGKGTTWIGQSVPDFFLIFLVQTILSYGMNHGLPRMDMYGDEHWYNVFFPILFLSMYPAFVIARYTSQALEEQSNQDYIMTARSKGIPERLVLRRHILRNALPKLFQHFMPIVLSLVSGMFVVEFLTMYHGMGTRLIQALHIVRFLRAGEPLPIDSTSVIGFSLAFMLFFLVAQWIGQVLTYFFVPVKRDELGGNILVQLGKSLLLWLAMAIGIIFIVLLPRDTGSYRVDMQEVMSYHFTWSNYSNNISHYMKDVISHKSLGTTNYDQPVEKELWLYLKRSIVILLPALFLSILIGVYKGVFDYKHKNKLGRIFGKGATWLGQSVPDFFLIFLIQTILSMGMRHGLPRLDMYGDEEWYNIFFPIIFLSMYPAFIIAKYTAQALEEEDDQDYIRTARAKGIPERVILWKHILRNCLPKLFQHFMPIVLTLVSGMFVVEFLTFYHGIGYRLITALHIKNSIMPGAALPIDIPAVIVFSLLLMFFFVVAQWISQIVTYFLDPTRKGSKH
ncbi:MAG: ABC transporter permease subunit [Heyndrickxia sp.]